MMSEWPTFEEYEAMLKSLPGYKECSVQLNRSGMSEITIGDKYYILSPNATIKFDEYYRDFINKKTDGSG